MYCIKTRNNPSITLAAVWEATDSGRVSCKMLCAKILHRGALTVQGGYQAAAQPFWHCLMQPSSCVSPVCGMGGLQPHDRYW